MNAHYSSQLKQAFVVGVSELQKLVGLLQDRIGKVSILAKCADDLSREFKTVEDLIAYENPKSKEIFHIHLSARSDDYSKAANIYFFGSWGSISIDCTGDEDVVSKFKEETLDVIAGMRPWYDMIHQIKFASAALIIFLILFVIFIPVPFLEMAVKFKWLSLSETKEKNFDLFVSVRNVMYIPKALFLTIFFGFNKFRDFFFPPSVFTIGQGESRFKDKERVQWCVIIAFFVSLAAGLVIPIIMIIV